MAKKTTPIWDLQPHTAAKHLILRRYLEAWLPIMARWNGRIVFIDGFAGPGRYSGGEKGSPIIALEAVLNHPFFAGPKRTSSVVFGFIEKDPQRKQLLDEEIASLKAEHPFPDSMSVTTMEGEFSGVINGLLDRLDKDGLRLAPTFAFIDPFGFSGTPMSVVGRIMKNPRCECLISFMYESVNRFLGHPEESIARNFDELFGTVEWRELVKLRNPDERRERILELYRSQLQKAAGASYVRTFEMINEGNRTEYFLLFATKSPLGLSKMKQAMWKADPSSGQAFSDRSDPLQMMLITPGVEAALVPLLQKRFKGAGWVSIEEVERFVLESTPFSEQIHLKTKTLKPLEEQKRINITRPSGKTRKGTYPPGTLIEFV